MNPVRARGRPSRYAAARTSIFLFQQQCRRIPSGVRQHRIGAGACGTLAVNMKAPVGRRGFFGVSLRPIPSSQVKVLGPFCPASFGGLPRRSVSGSCLRARRASVLRGRHGRAFNRYIFCRHAFVHVIASCRFGEVGVLTNRASLFVHHAKRCTAMTPVTGA